jgi:hypothetical protein
LSRDPIEERGGANLYAMLENQIVAQHRFRLGNGTIGALAAMFFWLAVHRTTECHQRPDVLTDGFDEQFNPALFPDHNQCP